MLFSTWYSRNNNWWCVDGSISSLLSLHFFLFSDRLVRRCINAYLSIYVTATFRDMYYVRRRIKRLRAVCWARGGLHVPCSPEVGLDG